MSMINIGKYIVLCTAVIIACTSCQPSKKTHQDRLYLQGIDSANIAAINVPDPQVQKNDVLSITVFSDNQAATNIFNQSQNGAGSSSVASAVVTDLSANASAGGVKGYQVDIQGNIYFYGLGLLHIEGLTKTQLKNMLQQKLDTFLKRPYVEIRFLNKHATLLGEIIKPGMISLPEERLSVLDAIALSGDITNYGRKDNILVIREENGRRTTARLDIRNPDIYRSEYFYLHNDDIVYIEPVRKKPTGTDATTVRNISLALTIVSTFAIIYSIFKK